MTDMQTITITDEDKALKTKHRAMWASGDYPALASDLIWSLGPRVVAAVDVQPGERVLDVAAGSGNAAIPAALRGASVVASDLTPELRAPGTGARRRRARPSSGFPPTSRRCRSATTSSTSWSRAWASCSRRITSVRPPSCCA